MTKIFPKFGRKTAADEVVHQIHELRRHGKLPDINQREEEEIADAIKEAFPSDKYIDTYQLYNKVFKPLGYKTGDLLDPQEIESVGSKIGLKESDINNFRAKHSLPDEDDEK